jgi:hypothetical protein
MEKKAKQREVRIQLFREDPFEVDLKIDRPGEAGVFPKKAKEPPVGHNSPFAF